MLLLRSPYHRCSLSEEDMASAATAEAMFRLSTTYLVRPRPLRTQTPRQQVQNRTVCRSRLPRRPPEELRTVVGAPSRSSVSAPDDHPTGLIRREDLPQEQKYSGNTSCAPYSSSDSCTNRGTCQVPARKPSFRLDTASSDARMHTCTMTLPHRASSAGPSPEG